MANEKHCDMSQAPKLKCKRCRYLQCLRVGMDPTRVLGVEERKKWTFPNKKKLQRGDGTEENEDTTEDNGNINEDNEAGTSTSEDQNEVVSANPDDVEDDRDYRDEIETDTGNISDNTGLNVDPSEHGTIQTFKPFNTGEKYRY